MAVPELVLVWVRERDCDFVSEAVVVCVCVGVSAWLSVDACVTVAACDGDWEDVPELLGVVN